MKKYVYSDQWVVCVNASIQELSVQMLIRTKIYFPRTLGGDRLYQEMWESPHNYNNTVCGNYTKSN